ncbi:isoprenylcysteine carboxylmethyltransferase family protein [Seongchinamella unica]|uniref:Isoprenylcysteine carboxylmethyltransferase family protein n=1 Tax=Seongchinamella unica TaxID=2547392 RepID=A0A4V2ZWZ9_9GAMM|nr:isoprenylcysteine carboxylmethyltransferase family protein [Seongchinamella unica]TDG12463.1 isoprenylcysteine carboxylmethyltransferase family protein [Seongchinamella unica]
MAAVKRIIYPPMWLALGIIAQFICNEYFPGSRFTSTGGQAVGSLVLLLGLALLVLAGGLFKQADTDLIPFREVRALVTSGVYRYTRNPMYLGMALVLLGCAIVLGVATAFAVPVIFVIIIQIRFILPEEQLLRALFPEEFPAYCQRVRRWI